MLFGRVISVGIGYLCGMFLSGFLYGKKENVDLRKVGSGNVGTTNTMRNLGVKAGILTLIGDVCKVFYGNGHCMAHFPEPLSGQCEGLRALCWCGLHLRS